MTTYPPGPISRYGRMLLAELRDPQITVVSPDGDHTFYLSGPLAPMPGEQTGVVLSKSIKGLHPMFNHLDYRGARQDGVTWADTVYDPAEIDMEIEFSGRTTAELRQVVRDWFAAWDPKKQCTLSWFTPEFGEWWCHPRLLKAPTNPLNKSPGRHRRLPLDWAMRNDDSFWRSQDSVSIFQIADVSVQDTFTRADAATLGGDWTQYYTTGSGTLGVKDNRAFWTVGGTTARECRAIHDTTSESDFQAVSLTTSTFYQYPAETVGHIDLYARVGDSGTTYIRAKIQPGQVTLSAVVGGVTEWTKTQAVGAIPSPNQTWALVVGTGLTTPRQYRLYYNGFEVMTATDPDVSELGASYRGWGFGTGAVAGTPQKPPSNPIETWVGVDNTTVTKSGFLPLTNRGTEDVRPIFICYGPGTFIIGNGPGVVGGNNPIRFGPLNPGQIAMLDADPRRKGVIDISPGQAAIAPSLHQQFINSLVSLATNANIIPLLNVWRSFFGVTPEQGPLYSKLSGRFTRPIPGHVDGTPLVTEQIGVVIEGGNAASKVVAAITPMRRWPE